MENRKAYAASGIFSNVEDLTQLITAQLEAYRQNNNPRLILTKEKMGRGSEGSYYGYGIFENKTARGIIYGHRGDMDGFASEYAYNPNKMWTSSFSPQVAEDG